jgi:3'-5' exoribonuclease
MATGAEPAVVKLADLVDGQEATCFALLASKYRGMSKRNEPFFKCQFRDRVTTLEAPIWANDPLFEDALQWVEGTAFRLRVRVSHHHQFGLQLALLGIRPASDEADAADGYNFHELVESSKYSVEALVGKLDALIERYVTEPHLKQLVRTLLEEHKDLFRKMPAAMNMHHAYTAGLLEHVWSMARISGFVADHYAQYYSELNPPLDKGVVVAAAILHDIGKIRELSYNPSGASYTTDGWLIGHILMGRDMVREAARKIAGFPEPILLNLEHAILSHHGKREFGAPVLPQTLEALLVSYIDELDAKINSAARSLLTCTTDDEFTDKVYALDNRRLYRGVPTAPPPDDAADAP